MMEVKVLSKRVTLTCKIKNVDKRIFERCLNNMLKHIDGTLIKNGDRYTLRSKRIGPFAMDVTLKNGQISVSGYDDYDGATNAKRMIENFYIATEIEEEFNAPIEMDEEGDILLTVEV